MSAYQEGRPNTVIPLPIKSDESFVASSVAEKLQGFVAIVQKLEHTCARETARADKLAEEYERSRAAFEALRLDGENRQNQMKAAIVEVESRYHGLLKASDEKYQNLHAEAEKRYREAVNHLRQLQGSLAERGRNETRLSAELTKVQSELSRYQRAWAEVAKRERRAADISGENVAMRADLKKLDAANRSLENALKAAESSLVSARKELETYSRENSALRSRLAESATTHRGLSEQVKLLESEFKSAQARARQLGESEREVAVLRAGLAESATRARRLEISNGELAEQARFLDAKFRGAQARAQQLADERAAAGTSERELAVLRARLAELTVTVEKAKSVESNLAAAQARVQQLTSERVEAGRALDLSEEENSRLRKKLSEFMNARSVEITQPSAEIVPPPKPPARPPGMPDSDAGLPVFTMDGPVIERFADCRRAADGERRDADLRKTEIIRALEETIKAESQRADCMVSEVERLRKLYPVKDLLALKEAEIKRTERELAALLPHSPNRKNVIQVLETLVSQRDSLRDVVRTAESRFEEQQRRIERANEPE